MTRGQVLATTGRLFTTLHYKHTIRPNHSKGEVGLSTQNDVRVSERMAACIGFGIDICPVCFGDQASA